MRSIFLMGTEVQSGGGGGGAMVLHLNYCFYSLDGRC